MMLHPVDVVARHDGLGEKIIVYYQRDDEGAAVRPFDRTRRPGIAPPVATQSVYGDLLIFSENPGVIAHSLSLCDKRISARKNAEPKDYRCICSRFFPAHRSGAFAVDRPAAVRIVDSLTCRHVDT